MGQNLFLASTQEDKVYIMSGVTSSVSTSFSTPTTGIADMTRSVTDGDFIYIDSDVDDIIFCVGLSNSVGSSYGLPALHLNPSGIEITDAGNLIHMGSYKDKVFVHDGEASTITDSFSTPDSSPKGLGIDESGNLLIGSDSDNLICQMDGVSSTVTDSISTPGDNAPRGVTYDFDDNALIIVDEDQYSPYDSIVFIMQGFSTTVSDSFSHPDPVTPRGACYPRYISTGLESVYPTTSVSWPRVTKKTILSAALYNSWQVELEAAEDDVANLLVNYSTLASLLGVVRTTQGSITINALEHDSLLGITSNQHHEKLHATNHMTSVDPIPCATSNAPGLMSTTQFNKLDAIPASATYDDMKVGNYTGNGTSQLINLGFSPLRIIVQPQTSQGVIKMEWQRGVTNVLCETLGGHNVSVSTPVRITAAGFYVENSANATGVSYRYMAQFHK